MQVVESSTLCELNPQEKKGKRGSNTAPNRTAWQTFSCNTHDYVNHDLTFEVRLIGLLNPRLLEDSIRHLMNKYAGFQDSINQPIGIHNVQLEELEIANYDPNTWELLLRLEAEQCDPIGQHLRHPCLIKVTEQEHRLLWNVQAAAYRPIVYRLIQELVHIYSTLEVDTSSYIYQSSTTDFTPLPLEEELSLLQDIDTFEMLELFTNHQLNKESSASSAGSRRTACTVNPPINTKLESLALAHNLHISDLVAAAVLTILYRYSGQDRFHVAMSDGRVGTSYLETSIQESETLADMALRINHDLDIAIRRQKDPRLLRQIAQLPAGTPCHQVRISKNNFPDASLHTANLRWELYETIDGLLGYELDVKLDTRDNALEVHFVHGAGKRELEIAQGMTAHILDLLHRYTLDPHIPIWQLTESIPPLRLRVAISSTFTSGLVADSLSFWLERLRVPYELCFAPYNQVFQQLLDPRSLLAANHEGINLILLRLEDVFQLQDSSQSEADQACALVDEWFQTLEAYRRMNMAPTQILILPSSDRIQADEHQLEWYENLTSLMIHNAGRVTNVTVTSHHDISRLYPTLTTTDAYADELGHVPYTSEYFAVIGTWAVRHIYPLLKLPYRMVIIECDDVIWSGSSSEGEQIEVGQHHSLLQQYFVNVQQRGTPICLCGANAEIDMIRAFRDQPSMPLRLRHITSWRFGSQHISAAVQEMANDQGVRLEEILYIGANPAFCEEVRVSCSGITVVRTSTDPDDMVSFLKDTWALDEHHFEGWNQKREELLV